MEIITDGLLKACHVNKQEKQKHTGEIALQKSLKQKIMHESATRGIHYSSFIKKKQLLSGSVFLLLQLYQIVKTSMKVKLLLLQIRLVAMRAKHYLIPSPTVAGSFEGGLVRSVTSKHDEVLLECRWSNSVINGESMPMKIFSAVMCFYHDITTQPPRTYNPNQN